MAGRKGWITKFFFTKQNYGKYNSETITSHFMFCLWFLCMMVCLWLWWFFMKYFLLGISFVERKNWIFFMSACPKSNFQEKLIIKTTGNLFLLLRDDLGIKLTILAAFLRWNAWNGSWTTFIILIEWWLI